MFSPSEQTPLTPSSRPDDGSISGTLKSSLLLSELPSKALSKVRSGAQVLIRSNHAKHFYSILYLVAWLLFFFLTSPPPLQLSNSFPFHLLVNKVAIRGSLHGWIKAQNFPAGELRWRRGSGGGRDSNGTASMRGMFDSPHVRGVPRKRA